MSAVHRGRCFCGAVTIEATGAPEQMGYCHCRDCRSYSGAPLTAFTLWRQDRVRVVEGGELIGRIDKTGMSERCHCTRCGGHLLAHHPSLGFTDVLAAILPSVAFVLEVHLNYESAVLRMADGLPKLRGFPAEVGGSGELLVD
jgi:hypothetical protein